MVIQSVLSALVGASSFILVPGSRRLQRTSSLLSEGSLGFELLYFSHLSPSWIICNISLHSLLSPHQIIFNKDFLSLNESLKQVLNVDSLVEHILQVEVFRVNSVHFLYKSMYVHFFVVGIRR